MRYNNDEMMFGSSSAAIPQVEARPLLRLVYLWMGLGLLTTAFVSFFIANTPELLKLASDLYLPIIIVQLILVIALNWGLRRMSPGLATVMFFVYAASMGVTLSFIFLAYELGDIAAAFFTTAGLFGAMTVVGFTTKVDLDRFGGFLMMALLGLVIAMFVNMLLQSSAISFIISVVGVILFTALTAYDTQKIKEMAADPDLQTHSGDLVKISILGALTLYLDFINLFLFLLRLFGSRD